MECCLCSLVTRGSKFSQNKNRHLRAVSFGVSIKNRGETATLVIENFALFPKFILFLEIGQRLSVLLIMLFS